MNRKIIAIGIISILLLTGLTTVSAVSDVKSLVTTVGSVNKETKVTTSEKVMVYRYGPDGSVKKIKLNIEPKNGQSNLGAIEKKVERLLKNDKEIQQFIASEPKLSKKIYSDGIGLHCAFLPPLLGILSGCIYYDFLPRVVLYRYLSISIGGVGKTFIDGKLVAEGPHRGLIGGFTGFLMFTPRLFGLTYINGYARYANVTPIS